MAIPANSYPGTLDFSSYQYKDDYLDVYKELVLPKKRLVLLDAIPEGKPVSNQQFYATEDNAKVRTVILSAGAATGDTSFSLSSGEAAYLQNGDVLIPHGVAAKTETVKVNSDPDTAGDTVAVTRNLNSEGAQAFDSGQVFRIVREVPEGSEADIYEFTGTTRRTFYTGTISHSIKLSEEAKEGKPQAYQMAELDRQEAKILLSLKGELEDLCYFGAGVARAASAHGQMEGIRRTIIRRAGSNIGTTAERWGYKNFCSHVNWLAENGVLDENSELYAFVTASMYAAAGLWGAGACTRDASDRTYGFETNVIHTTLGLDVPLIWGYFQQPDEYSILDMQHISRHPLGKRSLIRYSMAPGVLLNDYEGRRLLMTWGTKTYYADKAHWLQKNVTVSS